MWKKILGFLRNWHLFLGIWFLALSIAFLAVNWAFHRQIGVNEVKFAEEGAKLFASYFLSLVSLAISEALESRRQEKRVTEQRKLALLEIAGYRDKLDTIGCFDPGFFDFGSIPVQQNRAADAQRQVLNGTVKQVEEGLANLKQRILAGDPAFAIRNFDLIQGIDAFRDASSRHANHPSAETVRQLQKQSLLLIHSSERSV